MIYKCVSTIVSKYIIKIKKAMDLQKKKNKVLR